MLLDIKPHGNIVNRFILETMGSARITFERTETAFYITTDTREDENGSCQGWWFSENDLREAAELFLRLADELHDEEEREG